MRGEAERHTMPEMPLSEVAPLPTSLFGVYDAVPTHHHRRVRPTGAIPGDYDTAVLIPGTNPHNAMFFQDATNESVFGKECCEYSLHFTFPISY